MRARPTKVGDPRKERSAQRRVPYWFLVSASPRRINSRSKHPELVALEAEFALRLVDRDFVVAGPAGRAVVAVGFVHAGQHTLGREVAEAVHFQKLAHLLYRAVVGDQLFTGGEVDAVEAGMAD